MNQDILNLSSLAENARQRQIHALFTDPDRVGQFSLSAAGLFLDYSKQNITRGELSSLLSWAEKLSLKAKVTEMFAGEQINVTEKRAVLHTVLRAPAKVQQAVLGEGAGELAAAERQMADIVNKLCSGEISADDGETISHVLAIGIGGSYYGIKTALTALKPFHSTGLQLEVLANIDGGALMEKLAKLPAKTTAVVVISKTFTTQETMLNAAAVKTWMLEQSGDKDIIARQWFAVSTNLDKVSAFGISREHTLPMWDWVGGRFSLWSAVGLPLALAIGMENFSRLKAGAFAMDEHFQQAALSENMPVLLAMLGIWNRNFLEHGCQAILPYDHALRALPGYLQQTDMESNGKSVSIEGEALAWQTAPVVFGQEGTNSQHAFMQLMHQSQDIIPCDFIVALQGASDYHHHHQVLVANCFAQSEALMLGKTLAQARAELKAAGAGDEEIGRFAVHKTMKGNTPSNTLLLDALTPESLGALLALYEHKIFVQGVMWQINSFDQWGVELGKVLGNDVLSAMAGGESEQLSSSTTMLIERFIKQARSG
ncbi:glucose-6-phosphate isomerase [Thalassomonas haliotis]|uniref:glucose-6-phosphate isomerase n=1 Tax=Thalassomonas haliotis TaxID=485448 RepID=UPI0023613232|nr:glucose-6-phosphate isomerase [Thalassomonas haliotis]